MSDPKWSPAGQTMALEVVPDALPAWPRLDTLGLGVYEDAIAALREGVVVVGRRGETLAINPSALRLLGVDRAEWLQTKDHRTGWQLSYPGGDPCPPEQWPLRLCLLDGQARADMALQVRRPDGSAVWLSVSVMPLRRRGELEPYSAVAYFSELPAQSEGPAQLHDDLTRLPNRAAFQMQLDRALAEVEPRFALGCLELNHFKLINSVLGHAVGDTLLCQVADRLRAHAERATTLARFGGDEFALLWPGVASAAEAQALGEALRELLTAPFLVQEHEIYLGVSVGLSVCPHDGLDSAALLGRAESAAWRAKTSGRRAVQLSSAHLSARLSEQWQLESELRRALAGGQLHLVYQPILDARSGQAVAAEALARWTHPSLGEVPPARFIPVAEDAGLIHALGEWALRRACQAAAGWPGQIRLNVNVSALQFERPDFLGSVEAALSESGLPPERLELELTESAVTRAPALTAGRMQHLRQLGVRVAIDDFGTGYSNLGALRQLPLSALKMDRSFVAELEREPQQQPLIRAIVELGHALNLQVVAEGVETEGQRAMLSALGCDLLQGYGLARPGPSWPSAPPGRPDQPGWALGPRT